MDDYCRSVICHLFLFPCRACDSGVSITIKVSNQCRKPKAPIRILQIFHLKQPLWATEWFWNCWCTPHEEGAAVDTGLMSSLVLTIWKWVYYKTLKKANIIYVPQIWDMRLHFRHLHHIKIPKSISCFGVGKENPPKISINLGQSEMIKRVNDVGCQRIKDPRSNETCQAGTWRYFAPLVLFLQKSWNSMFERHVLLNSLPNGEHLSTAFMTVFLVWDAIVDLKDMN